MAGGGSSLEGAFTMIAAELREGRTVEETYLAVSRAATAVIPGADHAGIAIRSEGAFTTVAATDDVVRLVDDLQQDVGEGPCLEASIDNLTKLDNDIAHQSQWPRLAVPVLARTEIRSMLAFPLVHEGRRNGALNLFGDRPGAFDDQAIDSGAILAGFASVAILAAQQRRRADQLQEGLDTSREIGAATGLLMAAHGISSTDAFEMLSQASQRLNRKLRDIAAEMVRGGQRRER